MSDRQITPPESLAAAQGENNVTAIPTTRVPGLGLESAQQIVAGNNETIDLLPDESLAPSLNREERMSVARELRYKYVTNSTAGRRDNPACLIGR